MNSKWLAAILPGMLAMALAHAGLDEGNAAYERGDYAVALKEFQPLAERGDARAQLGRGVLYANGDGVPKDAAESAQWYRRAAEQGYAGAQYNLGVM